ncbi:HAD family hydrolase, partial [Acinetobacter baumannii]
MAGLSGLVGRRSWILEKQVSLSTAVEEATASLEAEGKTVFLAVREADMAVLAVSDTIGLHSLEAVAQLKAIGILPVIVTGDNLKAAQSV